MTDRMAASPVVRITANGSEDTLALIAARVLYELPRTARIGWAFACRQTAAELRRSQFGLLWLILTPLLYLGAYMALRAGMQDVAGPVAAALPHPLFVLAGLVIFQCWMEGLMAQFTEFQRNATFLRNIGIEPEIFFFSGLSGALFTSLPRLSIGLIGTIAWGAASGVSGVILFFLLGVTAVACGAAIGAVLAPIGVLLADLRRFIQSASLLLLVGSGVFFSPSMLLGTGLLPVLTLIPAASFLDVSRAVLLGNTAMLERALTFWLVVTPVLAFSATVFTRMTIRVLAERFR